jgi:glycine betaine/choline ABC-type transport system substrate-binding protein
MVFLVLAGPTSFLLNVCVTAAGDYVAALPRMSLQLFPFRDLDAWTRGWTLTYFIWWIAWAPFVGVFIARISRGRTIREYIIGVTLAPTLFSVLWFGVFGGTGIYEELHGAGGVAELVSEDVTTALFALYERVPLTALLSGVTLGLLFIFLVTSCDSATYVLGMLTSGGALVPPTRRKILWGVVIAALGAALMLTGNIEVLKAVVVTGAVPFVFVMLLQVVALLRALREERVPPRRHDEAPGRAGAAMLVLLAPLLLQGCGGGEPAVRIGVKSFAEQEILGSMVRQLCVQARIPVAPLVACGDTYGCQAALRSGEIDLMIEYSGTALLFAGEDLRDGDAGVERARALYQAWELEWLEPLGLDNGYLLAMRSDRALALQVRSIADLALLDTPLKVTSPGEYLRRSADGLPALCRRYGLRAEADPRVREDPAMRLQALLDGHADVAVLYATDGVMTDGRLTALDDPLGFFPPYEAAILVRRDTLTRHGGLLEALARLSGQVSNRSMRELNFAAQEEGRATELVARDFLAAQELLAPTAGPVGPDRAMKLAIHTEDDLDDMATSGLRAMRTVHPGRSVRLESRRDPLDAVRQGDARLAVVGAERFFARDGSGAVQREEGIEAVAVVGNRSVHVLRRAGDGAADPLGGRIGIPAAGGRARIAEDMLAAAGLVASASRSTGELLATLSEGGLDAVILAAAPGDIHVNRALRDDGLALASLDGWLTPPRAAALPYLLPGRIPAGTYPGQSEPLASMDAQVLLVGPAPGEAPLGQAGPAAALASRGRPVTRAVALALADATGHMEAPDPALPSAWRRVPGAGDGPRDPRAFDTILNLLAFAFLGWLAWLGFRPSPP